MMLKKNMVKYIEKQIKQGNINIHSEEKEFAEKNGLIGAENSNWEVMKPEQRFADAYIERGDKETDAFIENESAQFLKEPISFFKKNKREFMYMESSWWELIDVDAVSFENDDVFGTYDVMAGLKIQKKHEQGIRSFLDKNLDGDFGYDLMFDSNEGIWSLNFALEGVEGFEENLTLGEAFGMIYTFLFKLAEHIEIKQ